MSDVDFPAQPLPVVPEDALRICRDARARARHSNIAQSHGQSAARRSHGNAATGFTAATEAFSSDFAASTSAPRSRRRMRRSSFDAETDMTYNEEEGTVSITRLSRTFDEGATRNVRRRIAEARGMPHRQAVAVQAMNSRNTSSLQPLMNVLSRMPISGGGLSQYFLSDLFRRARNLHANQQANPPASSHLIENLAPLSEKMMQEGEVCAICQDDVCNSKHGEARQMPCHHAFHHSCLTPWLQQHNSCPVCRAEVESVCPMHNRRHRSQLIGEVREEAMARPEALEEARPRQNEVIRLLRAVSQAQSVARRHGSIPALSSVLPRHLRHLQAAPRAIPRAVAVERRNHASRVAPQQDLNISAPAPVPVPAPLAEEPASTPVAEVMVETEAADIAMRLEERDTPSPLTIGLAGPDAKELELEDASALDLKVFAGVSSHGMEPFLDACIIDESAEVPNLSMSVVHCSRGDDSVV